VPGHHADRAARLDGDLPENAELRFPRGVSDVTIATTTHRAWTDMPINVWGYLREYEQERDDILAAVDRVFRSGQLILGESVRGFENEFATWCGTRFGIGVDNGTNALALALRAVAVNPSDEVITVSNTAAGTVVAIASVGARARFVDVDPTTYLMDPSRLEDAITPRTTCIVPVHLYGQCVDMNAVATVAGKWGLKVVEDCAQAHGATFEGRMAGSMSDAAAFSFYPTKVLGAYGDAGMVLTNDEHVAQRIRRLRRYGMEQDDYVVEVGQNSRLDEIRRRSYAAVSYGSTRTSLGAVQLQSGIANGLQRYRSFSHASSPRVDTFTTSTWFGIQNETPFSTRWPRVAFASA
jgi:hypothetical protein